MESHVTLLNRKSLRLAELAPKEESRYTLRALSVTDKETVVTDGHLLVRVTHPKVDAGHFPTIPGFAAGKAFERVLLPVDAAKDIAKAIPTKTTIPILAHAALAVTTDADGAHLSVAVTDLDTHRVFSPKAMSGQYPNWQAVMPHEVPVFSISVDANLLLKLCKYVTEFKKDDNGPATVRMSFTGPQNAVRLDAVSKDTQQGMTALLMPVRADDKGEYAACWPLPVAVPVADPFADVPEYVGEDAVAVA